MLRVHRSLHSLPAAEVEEVDGAAGGIGKEDRLCHGEALGQRRTGAVVCLEPFQGRALHPLDENPDQLGVLAVQAEGDASFRPIPPGGLGHLLHEEVEVPQVIGLGHDILASPRRVRGQVEPLVEHVVLERAHPLVRHEPVYLLELVSRHNGDVVAIIGVGVSVRGGEDLWEDLSVRTALVEIVPASTEVADDRGHASHQRGFRLALRVLWEGAVDPQVEMGIHRTRQDHLPLGVDHLLGLRRVDALREGSDPPAADAHVVVTLADVRDDDCAVHDRQIIGLHAPSLPSCSPGKARRHGRP